MGRPYSSLAVPGGAFEELSALATSLGLEVRVGHRPACPKSCPGVSDDCWSVWIRYVEMETERGFVEAEAYGQTIDLAATRYWLDFAATSLHNRHTLRRFQIPPPFPGGPTERLALSDAIVMGIVDRLCGPPDAADVDDPLHPTGRCRCGGEGRCAWCLMTAIREERDALRAERDTLAIERDAFRLAARRTREVEAPGTDSASMAGTGWFPRTDEARAWERSVVIGGSVCVVVVYRTERGWYAGWTLNGSPRGPVDTFSGQVHRIGLRSACGYDLIVRCDQWATQAGGDP